MKYLVVILVVALVLWLMFGRRRGGSGEQRRSEPPEGVQPMVRCAHCGVHLPRSEALLLGDKAFCSAAHRDAGARGA